MEDRHGDPLAAISSSDPIAILPLTLLELHRIQGDEQIRLIDLVQISKPWQKLRLMDRDTHEQAFSLSRQAVVSKLAFSLSRPLRAENRHRSPRESAPRRSDYSRVPRCR